MKLNLKVIAIKPFNSRKELVKEQGGNILNESQSFKITYDTKEYHTVLGHLKKLGFFTAEAFVVNSEGKKAKTSKEDTAMINASVQSFFKEEETTVVDFKSAYEAQQKEIEELKAMVKESLRPKSELSIEDLRNKFLAETGKEALESWTGEEILNKLK